MTIKFNYMDAFSRNLGWITEYEQLKLKKSRVAIGGLGGVGGVYLLTCVRMGIERFNLAEFDTYELGNFNRQVGSSLASIGRSKLDVMIEQALAINPNLQIEKFPDGVDAENTNAFLQDCAVYLDGIDFFEIDVRRTIFKACQRLSIPAITCAPVAMGFAQLVFGDKSPPFDDFFNFDAYPNEFAPLLFLAGMAPAALHLGSLHDPSRIHFSERKVSSTMMGCEFCAGAAVTEMVKHILDRGNKMQAPEGLHYDAHSNRFKKTRLRWGNKGLLQRIKISIGIRQISQKNSLQYPYHHLFKNIRLLAPLQDVLNLAHWAPSGHNEQLCHIVDIPSPTTLLINVELPHFYADEEEVRRLAYMHFGIYFESLKQAASLYGFEVVWSDGGSPLLFHVSFNEHPSIEPEETAHYLRARFTDRRSYKTQELDASQIDALTSFASEFGYDFSFKESFADRWTYACAETTAVKIELADPPTAQAMLGAIDFTNSYSKDQLPFDSIDLSLFNKLLTKNVMQHPRLMAFFNKLGGSLFAIVDYAFIPHLRCAGHFSISRKSSYEQKSKTETWIMDGQMVQRMWLKATLSGLVLQPSYFLIAVARNTYFLEHLSSGIRKKAKKVQQFIQKNMGIEDAERIVFMGRLGFPKDRKINSRSTRRSRGR